LRFELDLHVHSRRSHDSLSRPKAIIRAAARNRLDGLAVTDHGTIKGALEVRRFAAGEHIEIIIGEEVATDLGDIIGLFIEEEIRSRDAFEVIDLVHSQGGIAVLPHPFRGHRRVEELAAVADLVETFNSRASQSMNTGAAELARTFSKPCVGGSDAHSVSEIGNCRTVVTGDDLRSAVAKGASEVSGRRTRPGTEAVSQAISSMRRGELHRVPLHLGKAVLDRLGSRN